MSNKEKTTLKGKTASVVLTLCFVAVIAMTGLFVYSSRQAREKEQLIKENQLASAEQEKSTSAAANDIVNQEPPTGSSDTGTSTGTDTGEGTGADTTENSAGNTADTDAETSALPDGLWFDDDSTLAWPASGTTIMGYSMDQTVYFKTLDQYRYNPAMIISGEAGEEITASAAGVVENIDVEPQTGVTVTLNMGNGYEAVYGQLKEVPVQVGDYLDAGALIGYLSEPTKYFSEEGTNLYFEVLKDGEAVDPVLFME